MVRNAEISLSGLLGWKQSSELTNASITLDADNLASATGRAYEDFSTLVNTGTIYYTQPEKAIDSAGFNAYLKSFVNGSINQVTNSVFKQISDLKQNDVLYKYESDFNHPIDNQTDFVGFEIDRAKCRDNVNTLNSVSMTFDADDTVKLLLFHSSKKEPVQSIEVSVLANTEVNTSLNWHLDETNGKYYVGYLTGSLTAKAYNRSYELANVKSTFNSIYLQEAKVDGHNIEELFDVNDIENVSDTYGLNFDISTYCDFTKSVESNKFKFVDAVGMQVAVNVLDLYINSNRSGRNERIGRGDAILALEGNNNPELGLITQGLRTRLQEEVEALRQLFVENPLIFRGTLS